jgi:hypothetical protein
MKIEIKLNVTNESRRRSREAIGEIPRKRVIPDKRRKPPKHKIQYFRTIDEN